MSDTLLDEATRLAGVFSGTSMDRTLRALVERVREAEAERQEWADLWQKASMGVLSLQGDAETLTRERDAARGKLDKVRAWLDDVYDDGTEWRDLRRLRAILDGDNGR